MLPDAVKNIQSADISDIISSQKRLGIIESTTLDKRRWGRPNIDDERIVSGPKYYYQRAIADQILNDLLAVPRGLTQVTSILASSGSLKTYFAFVNKVALYQVKYDDKAISKINLDRLVCKIPALASSGEDKLVSEIKSMDDIQLEQLASMMAASDIKNMDSRTIGFLAKMGFHYFLAKHILK
jgi:hypothetical protein